MEEKILELLGNINQEILTYEGDNLFDAGLLDSFLVIDFVAELEEAFHIDIDTKYMKEENFKTKEKIFSFMKKILEK